MDKGKPREIARVYKALGHPHRKRIIEMIGEKGKSGFKELQENLKISVGALYYHIDTLSDLITQDAQHKYILTQQGKLAYNLLKSGGEQLSSLFLTEVKKPKGPWSIFSLALQQVFLPGRLFLYISNKPIHYLPTTAMIIAFGAWIAAQANLKFILVFPDSLTTMPSTLMAAYFVISWLIFFSLSDLLATLLFKRKGGDLSLLIGSSFSFLPLILFSCLWHLMKILGVNFTGIGISILLILFQAWTIGIMSAAISLSKGLRIEKAALISFIATYINIAYILLTRVY